MFFKDLKKRVWGPPPTGPLIWRQTHIYIYYGEFPPNKSSTGCQTRTPECVPQAADGFFGNHVLGAVGGKDNCRPDDYLFARKNVSHSGSKTPKSNILWLPLGSSLNSTPGRLYVRLVQNVVDFNHRGLEKIIREVA